MFATLVLGSALAQAQGNDALDRCSKSECVHRKTFFDGFRTFHGAGLDEQAVGSLRLMLNLWDTTPEYVDKRWLAYMIATAYHESARRMYPVREGLEEDDESVVAYLEALRKQGYVRWVYWDPDPVTNQRYYGRGLVQLTHRRNYIRVGAMLGGELILTLGDVPDTALQPPVSVLALMTGMVEGWFNESEAPHLGQGLAFYLNDGDTGGGYTEARRTVNLLTPFDPIQFRLAAYAEIIEGFIVLVPQDEFKSDEVLEGGERKTATEITEELANAVAPGGVDATVEWGPKSDQPTILPDESPRVVRPIDPCAEFGVKVGVQPRGCKAKRAERKRRRTLKKCLREQANND